MRSLPVGVFALMTIVAVACGPVISANEITPITPLPRTNIASLVQATTSVPVRAIPDQTTTSAPPRSEEIVTVTPTPTPWSLNLPAGNAAAIAAATDVAMRPTPRHRLTFHDNSPVPIKFSEFYDGYDLRTGLILSDKLVSLDGREVVIEGYMAPPLKPELDFFVLTRIRLEFCPFCSTAADWPDDIALVYVLGDPIPVTERPLRLIGRLEVGPSVDQETGMVSLVRIYARTVEVLN